jgi:hypothetical protein
MMSFPFWDTVHDFYILRSTLIDYWSRGHGTDLSVDHDMWGPDFRETRPWRLINISHTRKSNRRTQKKTSLHSGTAVRAAVRGSRL